MGRNKYTAPKRSMGYIFKTLFIILLVMLLAYAAFSTAMTLSNMYVLATEGMALRAECVLTDGSALELSEYFTEGFINSDAALNSSSYDGFTVTDYNYSLSVTGFFALPWSNSARLRVVEKVTNVSATANEGNEGATVPGWTSSRMDIQFTRVDQRWYISGLDIIQLNPEDPPRGTPDLSLLEDAE